MEKSKLLTKTKLSELVGWSESTGRLWVKDFKDYIPTEINRNKVMYNQESLRILTFLKKLNELGLTKIEIKQIINKEELPINIKEEERFIEKCKIDRVHKVYNENIKDTIPSVRDMMIPYLEMIKEGGAYSASDITEKLVKCFKLSEEQRLMKYENNSDIIFLSRVRSVRYSLKKESYIEEINKLTYQITDHGLDLLNESGGEIQEEIEELEKVVDPLTVVKEKLNELKSELADNLLKQLRIVHWMKFEDIVVELLTTMGYGDGEVTQRTNDEGLDGVIKEDKLGLDNIYVQAKRYSANNSVGRDVVQSFSGALDGKGSRKGVFITTSYFTEGARKYAEKLESKKIILIDGIELSKLMISHNVGVDVNHTFVVKAIDYDYFKDE
ncbi:restriction endonuclease [Bacillus solitudinis]|uniref:restriction endonuclease n=1 Tax=Bacillus solitudinis TaxID=2014074 RepID=UPI000C23AA60|nr:restriction endonuclease [Bacillus solitudinis]